MSKSCQIFAVSHEAKDIEKELAIVQPFLKPGVKVAIESSTGDSGKLVNAQHLFFGRLVKAVILAGAEPILLYHAGEEHLGMEHLLQETMPQNRLGKRLRPALNYLQNRAAIDQVLSGKLSIARRKKLLELRTAYTLEAEELGHPPAQKELEDKIAELVSNLRVHKPRLAKLFFSAREETWGKILVQSKPDLIVAGFNHLPGVLQAVQTAGMFPQVKYLAARLSKKVRKMRRRAYGYDHPTKTWNRPKTFRP